MLTKLPKIAKIAMFLFLCYGNLLSRWCDIEANPTLKHSSVTFCHWNLNGLTAHDTIKISLLQACVTQHDYDIICLSETFLNSSIPTNDDRKSIDGWNLIGINNPIDLKRDRVCICYKQYIPLIKTGYFCTLNNSLVTEIPSQGEIYFQPVFIALLSEPSKVWWFQYKIWFNSE